MFAIIGPLNTSVKIEVAQKLLGDVLWTRLHQIKAFTRLT